MLKFIVPISGLCHAGFFFLFFLQSYLYNKVDFVGFYLLSFPYFHDVIW